MVSLLRKDVIDKQAHFLKKKLCRLYLEACKNLPSLKIAKLYFYISQKF